MKKTAVITNATSPDFFFPRWLRYYGTLFGRENLHVVTFAGSKHLFKDFGVGNVWELNTGFDDRIRANVTADLVVTLLNTYDVVLHSDVDEFLYADPARFSNLVEFVEDNTAPYVTAHGVDVIEMADDPALDLDAPILGSQRCYGLRSASLNKTCLTTVPVRWTEGFHGASVFPRFSGLYLFHFKFADLKRRIAWHELMLAGLTPDAPSYKYYSHGGAELSGVLSFTAGKPKSGVETQDQFDQRFLNSVCYNRVNQIYQGDFISQDFLFFIDEKFRLADGGVVPSTPSDILQRYDLARMTDPPEHMGLVKVLEAPKQTLRRMPEFVADLSGKGLELKSSAEQHIHGSYLVRRENVLLFGPNNLISPEGHWSCEARAFKRQFIEYLQAEFYKKIYPGPKPVIDSEGPELLLHILNLSQNDVEYIETPVFLATPLEPPIWGRWIITVAPKVAQFKQYGAGRKFMCCVEHDWQRAFLTLLGVEAHEILNHDPGRTYICADVMTVEYSDANMTVSDWERTNFFEMIMKHHVKIKNLPKIFVSRLSRSKKDPNYRVLQNEEALAAMLAELGFVTIEPEAFPFEEQISIFSAAEQVVFLGGSGVFNAVFCAPGASVVDIESSDTFINHHAGLLASLGLRYGVIFGEEDPSDHAQWHKRWTIDVARTRAALVAFFDGA